MGEIMGKASKKALSGGIAGMAAQAINVLALMWMRTIMNYQYRYGGGLTETVKKLYAEGGIPRFYRGLAPGLIQAPVSRFGDTAANDGALAALEHTTLPTAAKAMAATWVGHYPWFCTNNQLREVLPPFEFTYGKYVRNAVIGFASAAVSDTCSNSLRVLRTTRQTA